MFHHFKMPWIISTGAAMVAIFSWSKPFYSSSLNNYSTWSCHVFIPYNSSITIFSSYLIIFMIRGTNKIFRESATIFKWILYIFYCLLYVHVYKNIPYIVYNILIIIFFYYLTIFKNVDFTYFFINFFPLWKNMLLFIN